MTLLICHAQFCFGTFLFINVLYTRLPADLKSQGILSIYDAGNPIKTMLQTISTTNTLLPNHVLTKS